MVIIIIRMIIMIIFMCKNYETRYVNDHFRSHLFFSPVSSRRSTTSPDTSGNFPPPHFSSVCVNLSLSYSLYGPSAGFLVFLDWNHSFFFSRHLLYYRFILLWLAVGLFKKWFFFSFLPFHTHWRKNTNFCLNFKRYNRLFLLWNLLKGKN